LSAAAVIAIAPRSAQAEPGSAGVRREERPVAAGDEKRESKPVPKLESTTRTGVSIHLEGSAAHMFGENKGTQFGWGAVGLGTAELRLARFVGAEIGAGFIGLSQADEQDPRYVRSSSGSAGFAVAGLRLRPFAFGNESAADGLWIAGGGGASNTGGLIRPALDVRLGYDAQLKAFAFGPHVGMVQVLEHGTDRPQDARVFLVGLHASYDVVDRKAIAIDRDHDGIPDALDKCPDEAEDMDGFEDSDGCPDLDNDHDGVPDATDKCPDEAEDKDGFEDSDGCPDLDNDHDGIPDATDKCPSEAEDKDGFQDADGCPDPDNDQDGIPDATDKCPNDKETVNGFEDADGCPDEAQVRVSGDHILLDDRVHFRTDQSVIEPRSHGLLTSVAKLLNAHPEYELVQVQGHADDTGTADYNLKLSEARAKAVRAFLIGAGVDEKRLGVEYFGESKPRANGSSDEARKENRRVEFTIVRRRVLGNVVGNEAPPSLPAPLVPTQQQGADK
jgi:outer membrane protein OmpA-like peptidoglycan-associated protein